MNTCYLWLDVTAGPPVCTSGLEDVRSLSSWGWGGVVGFPGFWGRCHWPSPGTPFPPCIHFWLLLACFVLCPQLSRLWVELQRPCWLEVAGSPGPLYVCQHLCEYVCARLYLVMLRPRRAGAINGVRRLLSRGRKVLAEIRAAQ